MSNLLEKASIVTTPTAYDNGKILSVKPAPSLGSELITNGDFATDLSDWFVTDGAAGIEITWTANGVSFITDGAGGGIQQSVMTVGKLYLIEFDYTAVSGAIKMLPYFTDISETKRYSGYFVATTANIAFYRKVGGTEGIIDNVSVKEVIDGDFDFTRNSSATRVNSQGLIEDVQILSSNLVSNGDFSQEGSELVTNGDFATDTDWDKLSGATISSGQANLVFNGLGNPAVKQNIPIIQGKTYKIVFNVSRWVSGKLEVYVSGDTRSGFIVLNGVGQYEVILKINTVADIRFVGNGVASDISIDNVSVKEVGQDWEFNSTAILTANGMNITTGGYIRQDVVTIGKSYKLTYDIFSYTSGDIRLYDGTNQGSLPTSIGSNTFNFIAGGSNLVIQSNSVNVNLVITNISVVEITDDTNLPRIDYTGGEGHWLFEPQSTNLIPYSEDFSDAYWTKSGASITSNAVISPDGTLNADKLVESVGSGVHYLRSVVTIVSGNTYTKSFMVKKDNRRYFIITNSSLSGCVFDLDLGVVSLNSSGSVGTITPLLNGWYKVTETRAQTSGDTFCVFRDTNQLSISFTGDGVSGGYIYGAQVEAQSYATSYIPTNGSAVTRLKDAAFGSGSSDLINSTEGVLYAEISALANDNSTRVITLSNGTNANRVFIGYWTASNEIRVLVQVGGVTQVFQGNTSYDILNYNKVAFVYKENDFSLWINGSNVFNDTTGITFPAGTLTELDFDSNGSAFFFGKTKCVAVFKEALTDEELECLTTI